MSGVIRNTSLDLHAAPREQGGDTTLLTTSEAAARLRLSPRTLERLRVSGEGPRYVKAGPGTRARVFYLGRDLDAWLSQYQFASTSEYARRPRNAT